MLLVVKVRAGELGQCVEVEVAADRILADADQGLFEDRIEVREEEDDEKQGLRLGPQREERIAGNAEGRPPPPSCP